MNFESELITAAPTRRVVLELPVDRAEALATALDNGIVWGQTDVEDELDALYRALNGEVSF